MAQITIEKLYRGERNGEKYGGIMGAVTNELITHGIPEGYTKRTGIEMLCVKHTLAAAEQMENEGDFVSGMNDAESPLSMWKS